MIKNDIIFLEHINDEILRIEKFIESNSIDIFYRDEKTIYAVLKSLENIGEAAKNVSSGFKTKYSNIEWRTITDTRNFLVHEYFDIDLSEIWKTIKEDLPVLKKQIKDILNASQNKISS
jgi:uncharacterized protein with HEPN domain